MVTVEALAERDRRPLIKQNTHSSGQRRPGCVFQDVARLRQTHARKPINELLHGGVRLKVLKKSGNRNTGAPKNPGTTDAIRIALYIVAGGPINHG